MRLGKPSPELEGKLNPEFLPKGKVIDPEAFELYGISAATPRVEPTQGAAGAARAEGDADSGQAIRRRWTAGQRETVRNYFKEE